MHPCKVVRRSIHAFGHRNRNVDETTDRQALNLAFNNHHKAFLASEMWREREPATIIKRLHDNSNLEDTLSPIIRLSLFFFGPVASIGIRLTFTRL